MSRPLTLFVIRNKATGDYMLDPEEAFDEGPFHKAFIYRSPHRAAEMLEMLMDEAESELERSDNFFGLGKKPEFEYEILSFVLHDPGNLSEEDNETEESNDG